MANVFQGLALVLGATITILNAIEAFYDHRSLWIRETVTLARLRSLKAELDFAGAGLEGEQMDESSLKKFMRRYENILQDDLKAWLKLREDELPSGKSQSENSIKQDN